MNPSRLLAAVGVLMLLGGCGSMGSQTKLKHSARVMGYLFPDKVVDITPDASTLVTLKIPLSIGIAFVPGSIDPKKGLPESEQLRMLEQVKASFSKYPFVSTIEAIPTSYLTEKGGFEDLDKVASLFRVDVITLLSYDQVQFSDAARSSFWYWTVIGAYLVEGDEYDIYTTLEASTFDVGSRKLLFRAPGISTIAGSSEWVGFAEKTRLARIDGFNQALAALIPNIHQQLQNFRDWLKKSQSIQLDLPPGYDPQAVRP